MFSNNPEDLDNLLSKGIVPIVGEITRGTLPSVISRLTKLSLRQDEEYSTIQIVIASGGGDTEVGLAIADFISHGISSPVHAKAFGMVGSSATFIFAACDERVCTPNTRFLIHMSTTEAPLKHGRHSKKDLGLLGQSMETIDELMIAHYMRHLKIKEDEVKTLCDRGEQEFHRELTASEAKNIGLVTKVLTKRGESLELF